MRKFLVFLIILALVGLAGDRVAHRLATDAAASRLAARGLTEPTVEVGGFPFLDQLLRREFDQVRVGSRSVRTAGGSAGPVRLVARDVAAPSGGPVTVGRLSARGTVSYAEVLRQVDARGLRLRDGGDGTVRLRRDVTVLGRTLSATAIGRVEPRGRRLRVVATGVQLANGGALDDGLARALAERFAVVYTLAALPRGVVIRRVVPGAHGFVISASGRDVSFAYAG